MAPFQASNALGLCYPLELAPGSRRLRGRVGTLRDKEQANFQLVRFLDPLCVVPFCRQTPLTLKALRQKDYSEDPGTLGEHLKKRRRELSLLQREAAERMGIGTDTYANWEKGKTEPVAAQFRPVLEFLGYDPTLAPKTLAEKVQRKRRAIGATFSQVAQHLGWDTGTLTRYLNGTWRIPPSRAAQLEAFLVVEKSAVAGVLQLPRRR
jgi:transcriptional regulator with XRE-family HTH domain